GPSFDRFAATLTISASKSDRSAMGMANLSCSPILNQLDADLGSRESSPPGLGIRRQSDRYSNVGFAAWASIMNGSGSSPTTEGWRSELIGDVPGIVGVLRQEKAPG